MPRRGPQPKTEFANKVGRRLRTLREAQALSQAELARKAGTSRSVVHGIEEGNRAPALATLNNLASALGVNITKFFAGSGVEPAPPSASAAVLARILEKLRERDNDYLEAVEDFLRWMDRHHAPARGKRR